MFLFKTIRKNQKQLSVMTVMSKYWQIIYPGEFPCAKSEATAATAVIALTLMFRGDSPNKGRSCYFGHTGCDPGALGRSGVSPDVKYGISRTPQCYFSQKNDRGDENLI